MNKLIAIAAVLMCAAAGTAGASAFADLLAASGGEVASVQAPAPVPSSPAGQEDPFTVRKVYPMPASETWNGPFAIQFRKGADLAAVTKALKAEGLEAKELLNGSAGYYTRIAMGDEYAMVKVMRLTDYDDVAYIFVNKRLLGGART